MAANDRARFEALLTEMSEPLNLEWKQRALEQEILDAYKAKFPRSRPKLPEIRESGRWAKIRKLGGKIQDEFDEICNRHQAELELTLERRALRREEIREELVTIAEKLRPEPAAEARMVYVVHSSSYNTQGFGAVSYARADAQRCARDLEIHGIEVEIRNIEGDRVRNWRGNHSIQTAHFEVWAKCSEIDHQIALHKPGLTIKDELQWCWNRSINPRVMNPYLPTGLEEKLGVSFLPVHDAEGNLCP